MTGDVVETECRHEWRRLTETRSYCIWCKLVRVSPPQTKTEKLRAAAVRLRAMALDLQEHVVPLLDDGGSKCDCCGAMRYRNFPQKNARERVVGAAVRLDE